MNKFTAARYLPALSLITVVLGSLACGSSTSPTSPAVIKTATPEASVGNTQAPVAQATLTQAPQETSTTAPIETAAPTTTYLGDTVEQDGYFLSALTIEDPATPGLFYQAEAGKRLVAVEVVVGNISVSKLSVNPLSATLLDSEGFTYQAELGARDGQLATLDVNEGEKLRGWVAFKIPDAAKPATLKFSSSLFSGQGLQTGLATPPADYTALIVDTERKTPQLAKLGDAVEVGGYSLTAVTVEDPAKPGLIYQAKNGTRLVAVEIVVGNVSGEKLSVNPLYVILVDTEGFLYTAELAGRDGQINTIDLNSGEKVKGWVAFQVPDGTKLESIKFAPPFSDLVIQTGLTK